MPTTLRRHQILICEDSEMQALWIRGLIEDGAKENVNFVITRTLKDSLEFLKTSSPDVIILDINLPNGSGLEVLEKVIKINPDIPVIVVTSDESKETALEAIEKGSQDYIIKRDMDQKLLIRSIDYAIKRKEHQHRLIKMQGQLDKLQKATDKLAHDIFPDVNDKVQ